MRRILMSALVLVVAFSLVLAGTRVAAETECDVSWTGEGGDSSWHNANNWTSDEVPAAGQNTCILLADAEVEHTEGDHSVASLTIGYDSTLVMEGGSLTGHLLIGGTLNWRGGTIAGSADNHEIFRIETGEPKVLNGALVNGGTLIFAGDNALLSNESGGIIYKDVDGTATAAAAFVPGGITHARGGELRFTGGGVGSAAVLGALNADDGRHRLCQRQLRLGRRSRWPRRRRGRRQAHGDAVLKSSGFGIGLTGEGLTWESGTIAGSADNHEIFRIETIAKKVLNGALVNGGTLIFAGDSHIEAGDNALLSNEAGGVIYKDGSGIAEVEATFVTDGEVTIVDGGTLAFRQKYTQRSGITYLGGGTLETDQVVELEGGALSGTGEIAGDYRQLTAARYQIEIGSANTLIDITGTAELGGTLEISVADGSTLTPGDSFTVMTFGSRTGEFATVTGADLGGGLVFQVVYDATSVVLVVEQVTHTLTIEVDGQGWTDPAAGGHSIAEGSVVELTAVPDSGWMFSHWDGDATGNDPQTSVVMDDDKSVTAVFVQLHTLTIAVAGEGTTDPDPDDHDVAEGTEVELTATADPGWEFSHWVGDVANPDAASTTVTIDGDKSVTAVFTLIIRASETSIDCTPDIQEVNAEISRIATVTDAVPAEGATPPAGTVVFRLNGSDVADCDLGVLDAVSSSCSATFTSPEAMVGEVVAHYEGDAEPHEASDPMLVVFYDPDGGFVTGAGWFDSPADAYRPDPTVVGPAHFALVSRYQRGAHVPTGNTQFRFRAADLVFQSTSYEWLVISGPRAQYRGEGTLNGDAGYRFMITVIDGSVDGGGGVDRIRVRIWDPSDDLVYDNLPEAPDDADPTALSAGNIMIQSGGGGGNNH